MLSLRVRRAFSYTAQFLESVSLKPKAEGGKPQQQKSRVKFVLKATPLVVQEKPTLTGDEPNILDNILPGGGSTGSVKLSSHVTSMNPSLQMLEAEEVKAQEWVQEFLDPGKIPQPDPSPDEQPEHDEISLDEIFSVQAQMKYANDAYKPRITRREIERLSAQKFDPEEIKFYPGSKLGPDPEDDPEHWAEWFVNNQPKSLYPDDEPWEPEDILLRETGPETSIDIDDDGKTQLDEEGDPLNEASEGSMGQEGALSDEEEGNEEEDEGDLDEPPADDQEAEAEEQEEDDEDLGGVFDPAWRGPTYPVDSTPESFLTTEHEYDKICEQSPEREYMEGDEEGVLASGTPMMDPEDLGNMPKTVHPEHEKAIEDIERWSVFRVMPLLLKHKEVWPEMIRQYQNSKSAYKDVPLPSIIPYFEMLPQWFRAHRMMQGFAAGLERYKPEISRAKKEELLNHLCYYLAPKDPKRLLFLQEHYMKKYQPTTQELEEGNKTEMDFETKKRLGLVEDTLEMRVLRILGEDPLRNTESGSSSVTIEDMKVDWFTLDEENPKGKLPVTLTYYDNDDGYWDSWIKYKRDRDGGPEMVDRKHFRH